MKVNTDSKPKWSIRLFASVGAVTLLVAAAASVWHFFASQSPSSPLHIGPLVGPIESLATASWIAGFGAFALAAIFSVAGLEPKTERKIALFLVVGWLVLMVGFMTGAFLGTSGTQVIKAYPRTVVVLMIKLVGFVSVSTGLLFLAAWILRKPGGPRS